MKKIIKIILIFSIFMCLLCLSNGNSDKTREVITIKDKYIKRIYEKDLYLVGTENEVFKIEDNIFILKFNSSDIYNELEVGKSYYIETTGIRNNFFSWYRNINKIELKEN